MKKTLALVASITAAGILTGCAATEESRSLAVAKPAAASRAFTGARTPISVGKFDNRSSFMRGIFSDGVDRLGSQAKTILITHLQQTNRFNVLERENMSEIKQEAALNKVEQKLKGAHFVITGDVTQIDLPKHQKSGLKDAVEVLRGVDGVHFTFFESRDVVRHPLVARIVDAYDARGTV